MKRIVIVCSILLIAMLVKSQMVEDWTSPIALTDSLSYNSNPVVFCFNEFGEGDFMMVYEKRQSPDGPAQIWWQNISDASSEEQMLIGNISEADYRNPQFVWFSFLVFESNINGNYDLFGVKLDNNGLAGNIIQLTNTELDESSFCWYLDWDQDNCCWDYGGEIRVSELIYNQDSLSLLGYDILDSGDSHDPLFNWNYVVWRKIENNESHIYYSERTWPNYQWSEPDTIISINDNINLSFSTSVIYWGIYYVYDLCWQDDSNIYFTDPGGYYPASSPDIPGIEGYFEPTAFNLVMWSDNMPELYSFAGQTGPERDIYIVDEYFTGYVLNITNDEHINKNPRLFCGWTMENYYQIINIWQTEINGYDVLFESSAVYFATGGINENSKNQLNVFPNPVKDKAIIQFNVNEAIKSSIEISIFNNYGIRVDEIKIENQVSQGNKVTWNKGNLPAGIYFLVVRTDDEKFTKKFIVL
jgi:hypothetical protein